MRREARVIQNIQGIPGSGVYAVRQIQFNLDGAPRTKKNHGRVVIRAGRRYHIPSSAHERWFQEANTQAWAIRYDLRHAGVELPIREPVSVRAIFYRDRNLGDLVGYQQALGDWLEAVQILANDRQIVSWDGTRLAVDRQRPRIEVEIRWK